MGGRGVPFVRSAKTGDCPNAEDLGRMAHSQRKSPATIRLAAMATPMTSFDRNPFPGPAASRVTASCGATTW